MRRATHGLTLLELLLVLVIIALSVSLVYASLDGLLPSSRLGSAAREVGAAVALARREAVVRGQETRIEYDLDKGQVRVLVPGKAEAGLSGKTQMEPFGLPVGLPQKVKFEALLLSADDVRAGGVVSVTCLPTGGVAAHILHLRGEGELVYSIEVHALTGTINYHDSKRAWPAAQQDGQ